MVDHESMRNAMNNALESISYDFCNSCKKSINDSDGEFVDIITTTKIYKVWYCYDCLEIEE